MTDDIGTFWLPASKEVTCKGKILYDLERHPGAEIYDELIHQTFVSLEEFLNAAPIIQGDLAEGELTLVHNSFAGSTSRYNQVLQTFRAKYAFFGKHYDSIDDIKFNGVKFTLFNIDEWLNITGFKRYLGPPTRTEFIEPDTIVFKIREGTSCNITFHLNLDWTKRFGTGDKQYCTVSFGYPDAKPFMELVNDVTVFTHLLSFCTLEQSHATHVRFFDVDLPVKCHRYDKFRNLNPKHRQNRFQLLTYDTVKENFSEFTTAWFKAFENPDIRSVLTLALRVIRSRNTLSIFTFMDVTRALEVFHRSVLKSQKYEREEFDKVKNGLLAKMDVKEREVFAEGLHNAREKNLRLRIIDLVNEYLEADELVIKSLLQYDWMPDPDEQALLKKVVDVTSFARLISNTRNYHTHYSEDQEDKVATGDDSVRQLTGKVLTILFMCLTKHFGFKDYPHTLRVLSVY